MHSNNLFVANLPLRRRTLFLTNKEFFMFCVRQGELAACNGNNNSSDDVIKNNTAWVELWIVAQQIVECARQHLEYLLSLSSSPQHITNAGKMSTQTEQETRKYNEDDNENNHAVDNKISYQCTVTEWDETIVNVLSLLQVAVDKQIPAAKRFAAWDEAVTSMLYVIENYSNYSYNSIDNTSALYTNSTKLTIQSIENNTIGNDWWRCQEVQIQVLREVLKQFIVLFYNRGQEYIRERQKAIRNKEKTEEELLEYEEEEERKRTGPELTCDSDNDKKDKVIDKEHARFTWSVGGMLSHTLYQIMHESEVH